jgi:hypothetical protein
MRDIVFSSLPGLFLASNHSVASSTHQATARMRRVSGRPASRSPSPSPCCGLLKGPRAAGSTFRRHDRARNQQPQRARCGALKALGLPSRGRTWSTSPAAPAGCWCATTGARKPNRLVTRIDPSVVSLVAELRAPRAACRRRTGAVEDRRRGPTLAASRRFAS